MLISSKETELLNKRISSSYVTYCSGLFLSARWFVVSQLVDKGIHLVILPTKEAAEYCTSDFYNLIEGDKVFYLPDSGKNIEKSNYKSSLSVQRTASIGRIISYKEGEQLVIVSYPEALSELVPAGKEISNSVIKIKKGQDIDYEQLRKTLAESGFEKADFVSAPGQYALRGCN